MNRATLVCILTMPLTALACGGSAGEPDAGDPSDAATADAETPSDAGHDGGRDAGPLPEDGGPAPTLTVERWGERLYGPVLAMRRIERELWIGTGQVMDPSLGETAPVRSALARLDLDTGALRVFEEELPTARHWSGVDGPTPTASVVADGARRIAASRAGLLVIEDDAVTAHALTVGGASASPTHLALDRAGGRARLLASTDQGLVELDPDTLAVRDTLSLAALGGMPGSLAVDPSTGAIYVAVHPDEAASRVARVLEGAVTTLVPGEDGAPPGAVGDVVFSETLGGALVALASWDPRGGGVMLWDGDEARTLVDEDALSRAARGESVAFGASTLAYDEGSGVLVVGGRIHATGPIGILEGGGLAWVDVSDASAEPRLYGLSTSTSAIRGDVVTAAAYDPVDRRTYVALQQPCNELRIGNVGIHAIYFDRGEPRFELPILSGVRDLMRVDGELWVGLRDDTDAIACEGVEVQVGLARVDSARGALVPAIRGFDAGRFNVTQLDMRGDRRVVAGFRTELFAGGSGGGVLLSPPLDLGTSLWPEDVAWEDDRTFWVAGRASHSPGDPAHVADTGPRGAARVVLNEGGAVESVTLYVRLDRDSTPGVVTGLPSAEVYDVLVDESGVVHLVCGTERMIGTYDRVEREPFRIAGELRRGGVARIEADGSITVIAGPSVVPDGRAGAFAPDGTLYVLDADRGLLRQTSSGFEGVELAEVPSGSEPQTLWIGEGGDLVAGYDTGALVRVGEVSRFVGDVGVVWSATPDGDALLLGTDRGLVRVIPEGATDAAEPDPAAGEAPPFAASEPPPPPPPPPDGGVCLGDGEVCRDDPEGCCPGLICSSLGIVQLCAAP